MASFDHEGTEGEVAGRFLGDIASCTGTLVEELSVLSRTQATADLAKAAIEAKISALQIQLGKVDSSTAPARERVRETGHQAELLADRALAAGVPFSEVLPLLVLAGDRAYYNASVDRTKALLAEADALKRIKANDLAVRLDRNGIPIPYVVIKPPFRQSNGVAVELRRPSGDGGHTPRFYCENFVRLTSGGYIPNHGIYAGIDRLGEGATIGIRTDEYIGVDWALALKELGLNLSTVGVEHALVTKARRAALQVAASPYMSNTESTRAITAYYLMHSGSPKVVAASLVKAITSNTRGIWVKGTEPDRIALRANLIPRIEAVLRGKLGGQEPTSGLIEDTVASIVEQLNKPASQKPKPI